MPFESGTNLLRFEDYLVGSLQRSHSLDIRIHFLDDKDSSPRESQGGVPHPHHKRFAPGRSPGRASLRSRPSVGRSWPPEGPWDSGAMLARCPVGIKSESIARRSAPTRRAATPHEMGLYQRDLVSEAAAHKKPPVTRTGGELTGRRYKERITYPINDHDP